MRVHEITTTLLYVLLRTSITCSNSSTHAAMQTYVLFVQGQHDAHFIHLSNEDQRRGVIAIIVHVLDSTWGGYDYDLILQWTPITRVKLKHICSKQCKRTRCMFVHPGPTRQQVVYLDSKIVREIATSCILHRTPIEHLNPSMHTAIQTYALFVHDQRDTRFIHSTNEDQRRAVIIVIVVYFRSTWGWDYDCILHPKATTPSNSSTHAAMQTHALFVQGQHDTRSIHSTNKGQHRQSRHRHCSVFGEHVKMTLYYIDHQ